MDAARGYYSMDKQLLFIKLNGRCGYGMDEYLYPIVANGDNYLSNPWQFWFIKHLENKSNEWISNPDNPHTVPKPIAAPAQPGAFPSKVRNQWPRGNRSSTWARLEQKLSTTLTMLLKGSTAKQLSAFCEIVHSLCLEKFGEEVKRKKSDGSKQPNRQNRPPSFSLLPQHYQPPPPPLSPSPSLLLLHPEYI